MVEPNKYHDTSMEMRKVLADCDGYGVRDGGQV